MYLSYFGIRVSDLRRSAEFYSKLFGLVPVGGSKIPTTAPSEMSVVLLADPASGQRLELNYYPPGSPYAVPYVPGEGWDHLAFRVDDLDAFLRRLADEGVRPKTMKHYEGPMLATPSFRVAYISDPDGNEIELFDAPGAGTPKFDRNAY
jgi:lactoylglutathione lyase